MKQIQLLLIFFFLTVFVQAQTVRINEGPEFYQLYPRDTNNNSEIVISGIVLEKHYQSIILKVYKDGKVHENKITDLQYTEKQGANFRFLSVIKAGLFQYKFELYLKNKRGEELCYNADSVVCGDAYIITGQSNSHPHSSRSVFSSPYCRSFGVKTGYEAYINKHQKYRWGRATGSWEGDGMGGWSSVIPFGVGVWGIHLMEKLMKEFQVPICIINGGSGGSSIEENMFEAGKSPFETGFGKLVYRAIEAGLAKGIKAIFWHQGETNSIGEIHDVNKYPEKFDDLLKSWQGVFKNLSKVYVFQIHHGCGGEHQSRLREMQRGFAHKYNNVEVISTLGLPAHDGCHYGHEGYIAMAERLYPLVVRDFYDPKAYINAGLPDIVKAYYSKPGKEITLEFNKNVEWPVEKYYGHALEDYIYLDSKNGLIDKGFSNMNKVILTLKKNHNASVITYLPNWYYHNSKECYNGPWIKAENGDGVLSFDSFKIENFSKK